jgi:hypothetical protein
MTVPLKPLGIIKEMLDGIGLQITYAYDDLIFVEHTAFLLQMGESSKEVLLYFNTESANDKRNEITTLLQECGRQYRFQVNRKGTYSLVQNEEQKELQLQFFSDHL